MSLGMSLLDLAQNQRRKRRKEGRKEERKEGKDAMSLVGFERKRYI